MPFANRKKNDVHYSLAQSVVHKHSTLTREHTHRRAHTTATATADGDDEVEIMTEMTIQQHLYVHKYKSMTSINSNSHSFSLSLILFCFVAIAGAFVVVAVAAATPISCYLCVLYRFMLNSFISSSSRQIFPKLCLLFLFSHYIFITVTIIHWFVSVCSTLPSSSPQITSIPPIHIVRESVCVCVREEDSNWQRLSEQ